MLYLKMFIKFGTSNRKFPACALEIDFDASRETIWGKNCLEKKLSLEFSADLEQKISDWGSHIGLLCLSTKIVGKIIFWKL